MALTSLEVWAVIGLLALATLPVRTLFLFVPRHWQPRGRLEEALRWAPLAALVAITAPEVLRPVHAAALASPAGGGGPAVAALADPRVVAGVATLVVGRLTGSAFAAFAAGAGLYLLLG